MCDLPGPGIEPVSPALAGGFLTTASPGKSLFLHSTVDGHLGSFRFGDIMNTEAMNILGSVFW